MKRIPIARYPAPTFNQALEDIEKRFFLLHSFIRERFYQSIEEIISEIVALSAHEKYAETFKENIDRLFFENKTFSVQIEREENCSAVIKVIDQQLNGIYLLLSGIALLIFSQREKNVVLFMDFALKLIKSDKQKQIKNFLDLFLRAGLQVHQKDLAIPLFFSFLNLLDRAIYQRPSDNLLPFAKLFADMIQETPDKFSVPGAASLLSMTIHAYQREGKSAWDTLKSAIDVGNEDCFKAAMVLVDVFKLFSDEQMEVRDAIMRRQKIESQQFESDCGLSSSGSMSLKLNSERSHDEDAQHNPVAFFSPVLNTVKSAVAKPATKPVAAIMPQRYVRTMR